MKLETLVGQHYGSIMALLPAAAAAALGFLPLSPCCDGNSFHYFHHYTQYLHERSYSTAFLPQRKAVEQLCITAYK